MKTQSLNNWLASHGISQMDGPQADYFMTKDGRKCVYVLIQGEECGSESYALRALASRVARYAEPEGINKNRMIAVWRRRPAIIHGEFDLWRYSAELVMLGGNERLI